MLSPDQLELLTAAVDGELPPRRARRLRRLLAASAEARTALARLEADAARLRNLPKAAPPADLTARIMAKVAAAAPPVFASPARPATVPFRRRQWVPVAVAASLLLAVSVGSFLFFVRGTGGSNGPGPIAHNGDTPRNPGPVQISPEVAQSLPSEHDPVPSGPVGEDPTPPRVVARQDTRPATAPDPRPKADLATPPNPALIGAPLLPDVAPFDRVQVRLPFLAGSGDLDRDDIRAALAEELGRENASRIDLFVKDPARGVELLQAAARSVGLVVHSDAATAARVRGRTPTTAFVLFTESLSAAEVRNLLGRFVADDAKASARVFDTMHITPLHPADHRDLNTNVFGFDVSPAKKANTDPKPISAGTADQVAKTVGRGERSAALATYLPSTVRTPPAMSRELTQFGARRTDRKPNTIAVVIVVRYAGN